MNDNIMKKKHKKVCLFLLGSTLTISGMIIIPPLIKKIGSKVYKQNIRNDEIDFENMGPVIETYDENEEDE